MLAHSTKIAALLSVYDALQMSHELRESLMQALSDPQNYQSKMGPPNQVACLASVSFLDEEKYANVEDHNRPLFLFQGS